MSHMVSPFCSEFLVVMIAADPMVLDVCNTVLERMGCQVRVISDDHLARAGSFMAQRPDLVLLELGLPGRNGFEVCRHLKALTPERDVPVIFIGEGHDPVAREQGFAAGGVDFIAPPLLVAEVTTRLTTQLALVQARRQLDKETLRRQQVENALLVSEARFRGAFATAAHGMVLVAPQGRFLQVNPALCAMVGYPEQELLGMDFQAITHPDDLEVDLALVHQALAGVIPAFQLEKRYLHKSGAVVWVLSSVSLVRDDAGQPVHFVAHIQDISARKQAELALLISNEQLEMQVDCINNIQRLFIEESHPDALFDALLLEILRLTASDYGFIAEVKQDQEGRSFLQTLAISNIAWNDATRAYYEAHAPSGFQFTQMRGLYAAPFLSGEPVLSNDPAHDPRSCGLPPGHPPLHAFLGIPIWRQKEIVGVLGLANRPNGYDAAQVEFLEPLIATCAQIIEGYRNRTARAETEALLRHNEQQLRESFLYARSLLEASLDPLVTISADGKIMDVNRATEEVVQCRREELIGTDFSDYFTDPQQARAGYRRVWQEGSVRDYPLAIKQKNGRAVDVLYNASLYRDAHGNKQGIFAAARDITLRKRAETALHDSELRNRLIVHAAQVAVWDWDLRSDVTIWNEQLSELFGYPSGPLENSQPWWRERIHPEDLERITSSVADYLAQGERDSSWSAEYRFLCADGDWAIVYDWGMVIRNDQGNPSRFVGAMMDITQRKQVEDALRCHALALQRRINESECLREITNISLTRGWSADQMLEGCVRNIPSGLQDPSRISACIRIGDRIFQTPDFRVTDQKMSARIPLIHDQIGAVEVYYLGVGNPEPFCPEEQQLIDSIANQLGQSLERLNTEEELRQAMEQAEQAARAKSDFLSTMSHEIRTPINVVLGLTEVLLETELTPKQRRYMETMHHSGGALLGIINDVLDFSRIESGQFLLVDAAFCPAVLVDETARIMRVSAEQKNLSLTTRLATDLPGRTLGDDGRVRQILINLIGNAIKFTEQGLITVALQRQPESADHLLFSVADTGIGIAERHLEHIFDRFTQAESWTARRFGGTGLGLAISRRLAELMGGRLWVESQLGQGSTFFFVLPVRPVDAEDVALPTACVPSVPGSALRILLAEDCPENQMLFLAYLEKTAHVVSVVNNGVEAVERVREEAFDLVLMDIEMPLLNGYEATRRIRQWEREENRAPLVILALSAHVFAGKRQQSLDAGCQDHLTKPIRKQDLFLVLEKYSQERNRLPESSR
ncbi:MAG: PAS domain S-box protein [Magnetococcales bacterium]|nr:PAS domain S-box protein [Magnetococcales bacterium]